MLEIQGNYTTTENEMSVHFPCSTVVALILRSLGRLPESFWCFSRTPVLVFGKVNQGKMLNKVLCAICFKHHALNTEELGFKRVCLCRGIPQG